jgi:hypothetical protein
MAVHLVGIEADSVRFRTWAPSTRVARAARRSCTSLVTRWVRFDSERGLRLSFHCPRSTVVVHLTRKEVGSVRFRTWAPVVPKAPSSMPVRVGTANCGHFSRREAGLPSRASRVRISVSAPFLCERGRLVRRKSAKFFHASSILVVRSNDVQHWCALRAANLQWLGSIPRHVSNAPADGQRAVF